MMNNPGLHEINHFIQRTTALTRQQLQWLGLMEKWLSPAEFEATDAQIEEVIAGHVSLLTQIGGQLSAEGLNLQIDDPWSGERLPIAGFGYSTVEARYQVCVFSPEPTTLPLLGQLHIEAGSKQ